MAGLNLQTTSVCRHLSATCVLGWMAVLTNPVDAQPDTLVVKRVEGAASKIIVQGEIIGEIRHTQSGDIYVAGGNELLTVRTEVPAPLRFPRTITTVANFDGHHLVYSYTELTPPLPMKLEGMEGNSTADRRQIEDYFRNSAIVTPPREIQRRFEEVTGRPLMRWYEVSGLVQEGKASLDGTLISTFHTAYHKLPNGRYKEHHRGHSLELVDVLSVNPVGTDGDSDAVGLIAYRCGCHGYSESTPLTTVNGQGFSVDIKRQRGSFANRLPEDFLIHDHFGTRVFRLSLEFLQPNMEHVRYAFFERNATTAFATIDHTRSVGGRAEITIESSVKQSQLPASRSYGSARVK